MTLDKICLFSIQPISLIILPSFLDKECTNFGITFLYSVSFVTVYRGELDPSLLLLPLFGLEGPTYYCMESYLSNLYIDQRTNQATLVAIKN